MKKPLFSVISTAKNETDRQMINETFESWSLARELFEEKTGKKDSIEFTIADVIGNNGLAELTDEFGFRRIDENQYEKYRKSLEEKRKIWKGWDGPSIGRNLGNIYSNGKLRVFLDIDSCTSTGDLEFDSKSINTDLDHFGNFFYENWSVHRRADVAISNCSYRPRDSKGQRRRFSIMGENFLFWFYSYAPVVKIGKVYFISPKFPSPGICIKEEVVEKIRYDGEYLGPFNPRLNRDEGFLLTAQAREYGRTVFSRRSCVCLRTTNRVPEDSIIKSLEFAFRWSPTFATTGMKSNEGKTYDLKV